MKIARFKQLGVIEDADSRDLTSSKVLDTRTVHGWRKRQGRRDRRCRLVAREFKGNDSSTAETFAPTSTHAANRLMLVLHLLLRFQLLLC